VTKWWQQSELQNADLLIAEVDSPNGKFPITIFDGDCGISFAKSINQAIDWCLINGFTCTVTINERGQSESIQG